MYREILNKYKGKKEYLKNLIDLKEKEIEKIKDDLEYIEKAQVFIQDVAQKTQEKIVVEIEDIVNLALNIVFGNEYKFKLNFEMKRGKTEARMLVEREGNEIEIMNGVGGGVVDIISFALRISVLIISKQPYVIILDEPFRFLSLDLQAKAGEILQKLSEKLKIQFIIITHNKILAEYGDKVYYVKKNNKFSEVNL